jgi:hypothetical protein
MALPVTQRIAPDQFGEKTKLLPDIMTMGSASAQTRFPNRCQVHDYSRALLRRPGDRPTISSV